MTKNKQNCETMICSVREAEHEGDMKAKETRYDIKMFGLFSSLRGAGGFS